MAKSKSKNLANVLYAAFQDDVAFSIRDMKAYLRKGGELSYVEITAILDKLYINFAFELESENIPNPELWLTRAEVYLESATIKFVEIPLYNDILEDRSDDGDGSINIPEGYIEIDGIEYAIVEPSDYYALKRAGIDRRGRTIDSFKELAKYVSEIPAVYGIEIVYNVSGTITGYRVWVSRRTD